MEDDMMFFRRELNRLEGRVLDFGSYAGWLVEEVGRVNRPYLVWCLDAVPLRPEVRNTILRVLTRSPPQRSIGRR